MRCRVDGGGAFYGRWQDPGTGAGVLVVGCSETAGAAAVAERLAPACALLNFGAAALRADARPVDHGAAATLEWALWVERVSRVVLCGHTGCRAHGAAPADAARAERELAVSAWRRPLGPLSWQVSSEGEPFAAAEPAQAALVAQLRVLQSAGPMRELVRRGEVRVHAWWLDDATGAVSAWDAEARRFTALCEVELETQLGALGRAGPRPPVADSGLPRLHRGFRF